jgi:hypothetical protein
MRLTKEQLQEAIATIYGYLSQGKSDKYIMKKMGLASEDYDSLKVAMFDAKADEVRARPNEHVYVEYIINQAGNIRDLTKMVKEFHKSKQYNAMVGAIRARAEIYDKLIAKGQEFGLIKKTPERKEIVAGVLVAELSNTDLKRAVVGELNMLDKLTKKFGDGDILELEAPGDLHHGPALPPASGASDDRPKIKAKRVKAKTGKVHKGRRRKAPPAPIDVEVEDMR